MGLAPPAGPLEGRHQKERIFGRQVHNIDSIEISEMNNKLLFRYSFISALIIYFFTFRCLVTCGATDTVNIKTESSSPAAQQLVAEILAAYGGEKKFRQIYEQGCHGFGKYTQISSLSGAANNFDVEIFNKGDKIREEMKVLGEPLIGGFDGKRSWLKQGGEVIEDNPGNRDQTREEIEHGLQLLLKLPAKTTLLELRENNNPALTNCQALAVRTADGIATLIYADKKTHLISCTEFIGLDEEQGVPVTRSFHYEDYRPFSGTMLPYKTVNYSGDKKVSEVRLSSIIREPLPDIIFQVPKAQQTLIGKNESVSVPFQYLAGEILINVTVNGKPDLLFVVDTGATQSVIDSTEALKLGKTLQSDLSITTGAGSVPMSYMKLKTLVLGNLTFRSIPVVVADLSSLKLGPGKKLAGMLGANILRQFLITFDFPNQVIILSHPDSRLPDKHATIVPANPSLGGSALMVAGDLDGKKLDFLIDTGAAFSLIPFELARQFADKPLANESIVHGLDGKQVKVYSGQYKSLKLGAVTIDHPAFFIASDKTKSMGMLANGSVAILGNPIWKNFRVTLDYKKQRIILSRPAEAVRGDLPTR